MGFFTGLKRGFSFIGKAFTMGFENRALLKPSIYLVLTTFVYYVIWVGIIIASGINMGEGAGKAIGALILFGSFLIFYFFMGMTVHVVDKHLRGEEFSMKSAFDDAKQNFAAIAILALISTIVQIIANAARRAAAQRGGVAVVGKILVGIIESLWTVASYLLLPIIIVEDTGFGTSLKRATDIHKRNLLMIGIGEVGVRLATFLLNLVVVLILFLLLSAIGAIGGTTGLVLVLLVGGTAFGMLLAFNMFVRMTYYTCLYHWAAAVETEGQGAKAPAPLASALAP